MSKNDFEKNQIVEQALETKNLHLIQSVCNHAKEVGFKTSSYPHILELDQFQDSNPITLEKTLFNFALSSPLEMVYELVDRYPHFQPDQDYEKPIFAIKS